MFTGKGTPEGWIVGIQEPPWNSVTSSIQHLKGHQMIFQRNGKERPMAALYISRNMNTMPCPQYTDHEMATALWLIKGNELFDKAYVTSVYFKDLTHLEKGIPKNQRTPPVPRLLQNLMKRCKRENVPLIILADVNAHSIMWNMPKTNPRGEYIEKFILDNLDFT